MNEFRKELKISQEALNAHFKLSVELDDPLFEEFLKMGADPKTSFDYAMRIKAERGDLEAIKIIYEYGGDPEVALENAIRANHYSIVEFLMKEKGVKLHKWSRSDAMKNGDKKMICLIAECEN